jgi:large subunit ribosomal protein L25
MSNDFQINAEIRSNHGKADSRRLRHQDLIPAVIYGAEKDPQPIILEHKNIQHLLQNEAAYAHILTVNVSGKSEKVVLKAVQRHAYKPLIVHVDFLRIKAKEALTMRVPLHYINEEDCPGVKQGGVVSKLMNDVEITCLPANLPEFIEVDMAEVDMDQTLHLSDIKLPNDVELSIGEITEDNNQPIASIYKPKVVEDVDPTTEEGKGEASSDEETPAEES